jgi:hypothetical protein
VQPRGAFVVTGAFEARTAARGRRTRPGPACDAGARTGRQDTTEEATIEAVYGEAGRALLLVELTLPAGSDDVDVEAVLGSLTVDGDALADSCSLTVLTGPDPEVQRPGR